MGVCIQLTSLYLAGVLFLGISYETSEFIRDFKHVICLFYYLMTMAVYAICSCIKKEKCELEGNQENAPKVVQVKEIIKFTVTEV